MAGLIGFLVVALGVGFSIGMHELGHMIPAKLFGVRVDKYMIGLGPTIWSKKFGETLYGLKLLPLGGFCRMVGMLPPAPKGHVPQKGYFGEVVAQARAESVDEILPGEEHRAFYNLSAPKKVLVMAGGILTNLLMAVLFTAIAFAIPTEWPMEPTNTLASVSECMPENPEHPSHECVPTPAVAAGLQVGDRIVQFDGHRIRTWNALTAAIAGVADSQTVPITVERAGELVQLQLTPVNTVRYAGRDAEGNPFVDAQGQAITISGPFVGIGPAQVRASVFRAVGELASGTFSAVIGFPVAVFEVARSMITGAPRPGGVMSVVGIGRAAAEVAAVDAPIRILTATMFSLVASLNMALFAFNLIPLLPFDGGQVVNALFEGGRRTLGRIRGIRPLPGPADVARMLPVAYVVIPLLVLSFIVLLAADVINPISIFG